MNNEIIKNILRFILLVIIQVTLLNRINFLGFINPYLYVLFILLLPFETPRWLLLLSSFFLGLIIDAFTGTYGLHAGAATFMAFARPYILSTLTSRKEYEPGIQPGIRDLGFNWFLSYSAILVLLHHAFLFFVETFRFSEIMDTLLRVTLNSIMTLLLIFISQYLLYRKS